MIRVRPLEPAGRLIELDRPERRNALDLEGLAELDRVIAESVEAGVRSLVVAGCGGHFCAGGDLRAVAAGGDAYAIELGVAGQRVMRALEVAPLLTIAILEGACVGGGAELALACDIRIAVEGSYWAFPEVKVAVIPSWGGTRLLPRLAGLSRAKQMLLTGRPLGAELLALGGLVTAVLPDRAVADVEALSYVASAAETSRPAFAAIKELMALSGDVPADVGAWAERAADRALAADFTTAAREYAHVDAPGDRRA